MVRNSRWGRWNEISIQNRMKMKKEAYHLEIRKLFRRDWASIKVICEKCAESRNAWILRLSKVHLRVELQIRWATYWTSKKFFVRKNISKIIGKPSWCIKRLKMFKVTLKWEQITQVGGVEMSRYWFWRSRSWLGRPICGFCVRPQ
jgi:hypothetical protein